MAKQGNGQLIDGDPAELSNDWDASEWIWLSNQQTDDLMLFLSHMIRHKENKKIS